MPQVYSLLIFTATYQFFKTIYVGAKPYQTSSNSILNMWGNSLESASIITWDE